jgi:DNA primase large subunit
VTTAVVKPGDPAELANSEATPPCVKSWIQGLTTTGDLDHYQRVNLVLFLKALGYGVEDCVELFRRYAKDFSERVTRYQVEYLYGLRGRRVDWRPYSCARLGEMGLCPGCGWRGSPVTYYLRHARRVATHDSPPQGEGSPVLSRPIYTRSTN